MALLKHFGVVSYGVLPDLFFAALHAPCARRRFTFSTTPERAACVVDRCLRHTARTRRAHILLVQITSKIISVLYPRQFLLY
ncbi:unnamed protein product [Ectocarpus sp. 8 AP-2014]